MKHKQFLQLVVLSLGVILSACSKPYQNGTETDGSASGDGFGNAGVYDDNGFSNSGSGDIYGNQNTNSRARLGDFYEDPTYGVNVVGGPESSAKDRVIYFAYDSSQLDSRSMAVVHSHAEYLRNHSNIRVVLEGHTDERGSRQYNVALGERRAYSVRNQFIEQGVNPEQIRVLSYGEEQPAADCGSEECYAKNRRAVIIY